MVHLFMILYADNSEAYDWTDEQDQAHDMQANLISDPTVAVYHYYQIPIEGTLANYLFEQHGRQGA